MRYRVTNKIQITQERTCEVKKEGNRQEERGRKCASEITRARICLINQSSLVIRFALLFHNLLQQSMLFKRIGARSPASNTPLVVIRIFIQEKKIKHLI